MINQGYHLSIIVPISSSHYINHCTTPRKLLYFSESLGGTEQLFRGGLNLEDAMNEILQAVELYESTKLR